MPINYRIFFNTIQVLVAFFPARKRRNPKGSIRKGHFIDELDHKNGQLTFKLNISKMKVFPFQDFIPKIFKK